MYTRHILRDPRVDVAGAVLPHVLVLEGEPDAQVPTLLQRALVRSVGADFAGDDVGDTLQTRLLPGLRAIGKHASPSQTGNVMTVQGPRTAAVVRYAEDGHMDGHHVVFQRADTRALFGRFVHDVMAGRAPCVAPDVEDCAVIRTAP
jgi:hypothetical protein